MVKILCSWMDRCVHVCGFSKHHDSLSQNVLVAQLTFTSLICVVWLHLGCFWGFRGKDVCYANLCILLHTHLVPPPNCAILLYPAQWLLRSAVPCCSYQFERMFNTCRIPGTLTGSFLCFFFFTRQT